MKSDKITMLKRIQEIYQMICQGANSMDIVQYGAETWKIKQRGMYKLITVAMKYISKKTEKTIDDIRTEANIRFDNLYRKLYKEGKYRDAIYAQSQKNKINGLEIQKVEHPGTVDINDIKQMIIDNMKDDTTNK